jgi:hypothetical protein
MSPCLAIRYAFSLLPAAEFAKSHMITAETADDYSILHYFDTSNGAWRSEGSAADAPTPINVRPSY